MYIEYEKIGEKLKFAKGLFYNLKVRQNLTYISDNQKKVLKNLKKKEVFNVVFYVYDETKWKSQSVYDFMLNDKRFNPLIIVTKNCAPEGNANFQTKDDVKRCYKHFKDKGMNVEYGYDIDSDDFIPLKNFEPDLIFYSHPWYVYKTQGPVMCSEFALTYYVPYFLPASEKWFEYGLRFHKYIYRHYIPTDIVKDFYSKNMENHGKNLRVVGHPILDFYYLNKDNSREKKYIIYSPHWTVCGDNMRFGTFDWSGYEVLKFAQNHPRLNWVFRPHPLLYKFILTSGYMKKEEIDKYYDAWKKISLYSTGGDYLNLFQESYAMITDCGSFLSEYFVSGNPVIHLISDKFTGNPFIDEIDKTYYCAHTVEELTEHLNEVILKRNDYKNKAREELLNKFNLKDNYCAESIVKDILSDFN